MRPGEIETVRYILLEKWDPIGVRDVAQAQDEYDRYLPGILEILRSGAEGPVLTQHILQIEREQMGLAGDQSRAERAALALRAEWVKRNS